MTFKSSYLVLIVGILFLLAVVTALFLKDTSSQTQHTAGTILSVTVTPSVALSPTPIAITEEERTEIDTWISNNKLNQFGDPIDTVYAGGSPLFNEGSGTSMNRYVYIKQEHPDQPWKY